MDLSTITIADFKARFYRDFTYAASNDAVRDQDIVIAFGEAQALFNQALFGPDARIIQAYLLLTAHCLCQDLKAAGAGIYGTGAFPMTGRTVGSVSETYGIPKAYLDSPILAMYTQTSYGLQYLALALPALAGNMVAVYGGTNP